MGIITKGLSMGRAYLRNQASKKTFKAAKGTTKLQHPVIKSVPVSPSVKKGDIKESTRLGRQHFYLKNIDEVNKHVTDIKKGEKAKKGLKQMRDTKRAFKIGKKKTFPSDPAAKNK